MRKKESKLASANTERRYELFGIGIFVAGLLALAGSFGWNAGFVGGHFSKFLHYFFGVGTIPVIFVILLIGLQYITKHHGIVYSLRFFGMTTFFVSLLAIYHHFTIAPGAEILPESLPQGGGLLGGGALLLLRKFFGVDGGIIVLGAGVVSSVLLFTKWSLGNGLLKTKDKAVQGASAAGTAIAATYGHVAEVGEMMEEHVVAPVKERVISAFDDREEEAASAQPMAQEEMQIPHSNEEMETAQFTPSMTAFVAEEIPQPRMSVDTLMDEIPASAEPQEEPEEAPITGERQAAEAPAASLQAAHTDEDTQELDLDVPDFTIEYGADEAWDEASEASAEPPTSHETISPPPTAVPVPAPAAADAGAGKEPPQPVVKPYELPKVEYLLSKRVKKKNAAVEMEIQENAVKLQQTLEDFKVKARIINACHGPAVTRYELEPAPGVKVSKITNLAEDLALSLAAFSIRIEPIPGKAAIGIEVPNRELEGVQLREVLEAPEFEAAASKLTVGLGKDIGGQAIFADLGKMPHLLVAGATGSGKSVCINTLITSILFKAKPDEVKFILIDPKMVELSGYNGIPHLMVPVVIDAKKAASVLNWAVQEMEKRYAKFAEKVVRNMATYNEHFPEDKMPAIVIIIDELADLMMVAPHDVEDAICRLAQKARAAGIHLVLATQRPSVDVITGIIKANIPSRISFAVSSQIDSRTILDMSGAEKLLGKGDMLFFPIGASKPRRVQGAFVSDEEVEHLLDFIRAQGQEAEPNEEIINFTEQAALEEADAKGNGKKDNAPKVDELLGDAVALVMSTGIASASGVQRRFRIGYTRAARLLDTMEELQIVGPSLGSKPREILMTSEQAMATVEHAVSGA